MGECSMGTVELLREQLRIHEQNLAKLELQAARHGMDVPLALQNQIDFEKRKIEELRERVAEAFYAEGQQHFRARRWAEAVEAFEQALAFMPGYEDAKALLAEARAERARLEEERERQERARAAYEEGLGHFQAGRWEEAIGAFERALALVPDYEDATERVEKARAEAAVLPTEAVKPVAFVEGEEVAPFWQRVPVWGWAAVGAAVLLIAAGAIFLGGRGSKPNSASVAVPVPTATAVPTVTSVPMVLPTATLYPTDTPYPTYTPGPTDTPVPPTPTPVVPTDTPTPVPTETPIPPTPTDTPQPPTPTDTPVPPTAALSVVGRIAFVSERDENAEVYVMNADGTDQTRLTNNSAHDSHPRWSPDGQRIAFVSDRSGRRQIYVMDTDRSNIMQVTNDMAGAWDATWSPDGSQIAYVSSRDGNSELFVMREDGSGLIRLTNNTANEGSLAWSPDGRLIAFKREIDDDRHTDIFVIDVNTLETTRLTYRATYSYHPAWSPDGQRIAFASGDVWMMNADGTDLHSLGVEIGAWSPVWSPDGGYIAFNCYDPNQDIYVIRTDGAGLARLTQSASSDYGPAWAP